MEPNEHLIERMMTLISSSGDNVCCKSSTELDSHADMVVIGKQAFVFSHSGQYANVQAFTDEVNVLLEEDAMRVQVASVSGAYDPEIFCEIINEQVATSKFSAAVGSTMEKPQDPDCEILY